MLYLLLAILFFGILIGVHELGHFLAAKLSGVRVNEFAIGMGPVLWSHQGRETRYALRLFPIGGFCAMEGEETLSDDPRSYHSASAWKRFFILISGAAMNFLLGLVILICLCASSYHASTVIASFAEGCPAAEYLQVGDQILSIDGKTVFISGDITTLLGRGNGETVDFVVRRNGEIVTLKDVPLYLAAYTSDGVTSVRYGLNFCWAESTFLGNARYALLSSIAFARSVWYGLEDLFVGDADVGDLSGPIGIVDTMSEVGESSASVLEAVLNLLYIGAFIAINLAVMNLLPLPALDGGRLFFLLLNAVLGLLLRRQIPLKYESYVHFAGMILLLALMLFVGINDVLKLIGG